MQELQLVQEKRGVWHVCAAYVDGRLVRSWGEHPGWTYETGVHRQRQTLSGVTRLRDATAFCELRRLADGKRVLPLAFVPRKFENWRLGRTVNGDVETPWGQPIERRVQPDPGVEDDADCDVWPVLLDDLREHFVHVPRGDDTEDAWPLTLPIDALVTLDTTTPAGV